MHAVCRAERRRIKVIASDYFTTPCKCLCAADSQNGRRKNGNFARVRLGNTARVAAESCGGGRCHKTSSIPRAYLDRDLVWLDSDPVKRIRHPPPPGRGRSARLHRKNRAFYGRMVGSHITVVTGVQM